MKVWEIWKNRAYIWQGIKNTVFKRDSVEIIAKKRISICRSNVCGFYDEKGSSEKAYIKGKEACSGCGCNLDWKTHSLSSSCYLKSIGKEALWDSVIQK